MRGPRLVAVCVAVLTAGLLVAATAIGSLAPSAARMLALLAVGVLAALVTTLGLLVARRRPDNVVGALLCLMGLGPVLVALAATYDAVVRARPGVLPVSSVVVGLEQGSWVVLYVPVALLMLVFPDGHLLPGRRWRVVAAALVLDAVAFDVLAGTVPGRYPTPHEQVPHALGTLPTAAVPVVVALLPTLLVLLVLSAVALRLRYRHADAVGRAQLRWFALAGLLVPATLLGGWAGLLLLGRPDILGIPGLVLVYLGVPAATAVAILRHDLYDVDRALSAAITYGVVTTGVLAAFSLTALVGGAVTSQGSPVLAAATSALCVLAANPLRRRVQRRVDARLYPARSATLTALDELTARAHGGRDRPEHLELTLRQALREPTLRVGYRVPGVDGFVEATGRPLLPEQQAATDVVLDGLPIGVLFHDDRSRPDLYREVAAAAAPLVEVVCLRVELAAALRDVEASRTRLLHLGYEERRRLERDLHDGAQQRLVSLGMALRRAQGHLADREIDVNGLLDEAVAELATSVAELRQIAHGLRPSSLEAGLGPALSAITHRSPVPVALDISAHDLPDDLATTIYYIAAEAVANAVKHARAGEIGLRITPGDALVSVLVTDDGLGGASIGPGSGLAGMADRVAAAGGVLNVHSPPGCGTVIEAVLPCES
jgi:signal transduction histidine kinase